MLNAKTFYSKILLLFAAAILFLTSNAFCQTTEIYVSDAGNFSSPPWKIIKFDENGESPETFINTNLAWPQDIVFLEEQQVVLISNLNTGRITKYNSTTGVYIEDFATGIGGPTRMKIGADSLLYVLQWGGNGKVKRYELDGTFVDDFTSVGVSQSIGIDWDSNGNLYVSSYSEDNVRKFDQDGNDMGLFVTTNLLGPTNIWFDENGELLVIDYNGTAVKRYNTSGTFINNFITGLGNAEGVDFFPNGNILIGNGATSSVKMFDSNGNYIEDLIPSGSGGLMTPNAVVIRETNVLSVDDNTLKSNSFILEQNYPNPFNPTTNIRFRIADRGFATLTVFNVLGNEIETLFNKELEKGEYQFAFDASGIPSGVYFYQLKVGSIIQTNKMVLLR
jgi:sugar lactone lactonase YvrE